MAACSFPNFFVPLRISPFQISSSSARLFSSQSSLFSSSIFQHHQHAMSTWKFDFTGRVQRLKRDGKSKDMIIEKQLTEVENEQTAQRYALVLARRLDRDLRVMLKIRYE
jgi:hypothetical protein